MAEKGLSGRGSKRAYFGPILGLLLRGLLSGPGQAWPGPVLDYGPYGAILAQAWPGLARTGSEGLPKGAQNRPKIGLFWASNLPIPEQIPYGLAQIGPKRAYFGPILGPKRAPKWVHFGSPFGTGSGPDYGPYAAILAQKGSKRGSKMGPK